ncbi:ATP-binding protein [Dapis sp. BLCC M126]|uniref:ATP-binding protein n=1 Tax=Dapis sp. BLCC M126 TaxID=3400189 RepID=UPI003CF9B013
MSNKSSKPEPDKKIDDLIILEDEDLIFLEEEETEESPVRGIGNTWAILIVDDDPSVHQATKLALKNLEFEGKGIEFIYAYSGAEAKKVLHSNPDIALALLDVVMETNDAGLEVVRYIREDLNNRKVQIILRTGQPGEAPEESVIINYEINDYKLKIDLTRQKLVTTTIAALRAYQNIATIERQTEELAHALQLLQDTQLQLVQNEKMAMLGNWAAGVAHEINNPVGFIRGNISAAQEHLQDLLTAISLYGEHSNLPDEIVEKLEDLELEFIAEDFPKLIGSMEEGCDIIRNISTSLRTFSRTDTANKTKFNLHDGIDNTLLILKYRLQANEKRPAIKIIKNYGNIPEVKCYPGQLNQVFMNVFANGIDALDESNGDKSFEEIEKEPNQITIETEFSADKQSVILKIADNGMGMPEELKARVFEQGFTTKGVGKGTGLGMAIAHQIVIEKHSGKIRCDSTVGAGTTFTIVIPR